MARQMVSTSRSERRRLNLPWDRISRHRPQLAGEDGVSGRGGSRLEFPKVPAAISTNYLLMVATREELELVRSLLHRLLKVVTREKLELDLVCLLHRVIYSRLPPEKRWNRT